jgi:nucleoside-diphosphate-sugar epimerase
MRIVITGASGNIGTALLRRLAQTDHDLIGVSRRKPPEVDPYQHARWVQLDIAAPDAPARLAEVCQGVDAVVHLAWLIQPSRDRELLRRVNQEGTRAVARAVEQAGVPHLVHMSSIGTYAPAAQTWVDESWPATGVASSSYSVDKAAAEAIVRRVDAAVACVRPSLVLQPDAASEISRYFLGRLVPVSLLHPALFRVTPWPRELAIQFVHADDVAEALALILDRRTSGPVNLAADPVMDRQQAKRSFGGVGPALPLKALRVAADLSWRAHLQPTDAGWIDLAASVPLLETTRAREGLGWKPVHRGDETLLSLLAAMRRRQGGAGALLYPRRLFAR